MQTTKNDIMEECRKMNLVLMEQHDEVALLKLNKSTTNPLDLQLLEALSDCLRKVKDDPGVSSLVLASSNDKIFSLGFDIPQLFGLGKEDLETFYTTFNRVSMELYTLPKPTAAALTGHAIAGGCILALCCDYRYMAKGRKLMGLNEIKLGVPIPYPADCMLRQLVGFNRAREITDMGEFYKPEELLSLGMVDEVMAPDEVLPMAVDRIKVLGSMPSYAFRRIKENRVEEVVAQVREHLADREKYFMDCWFSHDTRKLLSDAIKKF